MMMRFTYHALNMLCVLLLCVGDMSSFPILYPSISKGVGFLGESEVEHRDYIDSRFKWIVCIAVVTKK